MLTPETVQKDGLPLAYAVNKIYAGQINDLAISPELKARLIETHTKTTADWVAQILEPQDYMKLAKSRREGLPSGKEEPMPGNPNGKIITLGDVNHDPRVEKDGSESKKPDYKYKDIRSTNTRDKHKRSGKVQGVVIHHTGGSSLIGAIEHGKKSGTGTQYYITADGTVHQYANDNMKTVHMRSHGDKYRTDKGKWKHLNNDTAIGIEIVSPDDASVTPAQKQAAANLIRQLQNKHGFDSANVVGHGELQGGAGGNKRTAEGHSVLSFVRNRGANEGGSVVENFRNPAVSDAPKNAFAERLFSDENQAKVAARRDEGLKAETAKSLKGKPSAEIEKENGALRAALEQTPDNQELQTRLEASEAFKEAQIVGLRNDTVQYAKEQGTADVKPIRWDSEHLVQDLMDRMKTGDEIARIYKTSPQYLTQAEKGYLSERFNQMPLYDQTQLLTALVTGAKGNAGKILAICAGFQNRYVWPSPQTHFPSSSMNCNTQYPFTSVLPALA